MTTTTTTPTRLAGHLELVCGLDARGQSSLRRQSFCAPAHLSKPHHDAGTLVVNLVNPTAGFLAGDRLRIDVQVERGARLLLTAPSASRVHTMCGADCSDDEARAEVRQSFRVAAGGSLEWWPELLIPQRGARLHQRTSIELEAGAELIFLETLAPGRVASGEVFAFDEIRWATDLRRGGRLLVRERFHLNQKNGSLGALRRQFPTAYYASVLVVSPALAALATLAGFDEAWIGVSKLAEGAFALKMLAPDSLTLRRQLAHWRVEIHRQLGRACPSLRR
ncbi:MAG: urease accessory protein UreD [Verrucomicrobia bacterium]|nr:urease accessory protein UreD [Verrucomicrobiota bacterium]